MSYPQDLQQAVQERLAQRAQGPQDLQAKEIARWRERAERAEKALVLIGERAVVDFDDGVVGEVDAVVPYGTYSEWVRYVMGRSDKFTALQEELGNLQKRLKRLRDLETQDEGIVMVRREAVREQSRLQELVRELEAQLAQTRSDLRLARSYPLLCDEVVEQVYRRALNQSLREQDRKMVTAVVSDAWHRGAQHSQQARVEADRLLDEVHGLEERLDGALALLRSACSIAARKGQEVDWDAFGASCEAFVRHHTPRAAEPHVLSPDAFAQLEKILDDPSPPTEALVQAAQKYRDEVRSVRLVSEPVTTKETK